MLLVTVVLLLLARSSSLAHAQVWRRRGACLSARAGCVLIQQLDHACCIPHHPPAVCRPPPQMQQQAPCCCCSSPAPAPDSHSSWRCRTGWPRAPPTCCSTSAQQTRQRGRRSRRPSASGASRSLASPTARCLGRWGGGPQLDGSQTTRLQLICLPLCPTSQGYYYGNVAAVRFGGQLVLAVRKIQFHLTPRTSVADYPPPGKPGACDAGARCKRPGEPCQCMRAHHVCPPAAPACTHRPKMDQLVDQPHQRVHRRRSHAAAAGLR
jgi:hypothetical protein